MKIRLFVAALLVILVSASVAEAQPYRHRGYYRGYHRGYYRRPVVVVPPRPVIVHRGYYGPRYRRGYYRRPYYYGRPYYGYRRGYYGRGYGRGYGRPHYYGHRYHRRW